MAISSTAGGAVAGLFIWFWKTWISEKIKGQIKHEHDLEIERIKSVLGIATAERQFLFSRLHEKRADVIAEVYASLKEAISATNAHVGSLKIDKGEREKARHTARGAIDAFVKLHDRKRLFLPQSTAKTLDNIIYELEMSFNLHVAADLDLGDTKDQSEQWWKAIERLDRLSDKAVKELEHEFRSLLGE